jgi:type IV pilus assembly protein PilM
MISVGLDISSKNISIIEVIKNRKGTAIRNAVNFEISPDAIRKGELQDPVVLSKGLKDAWKKFKISGRNVYVGLSNLKAIVKEVELPLVDDDEIRNSLKYQINDFIPIPKNNILYDYYIMEKKKSSSKIMLVGAMKSMITNVIEAVKGAGLISEAIDLNCFSLFRTLDYVYNFSRNKNSLCVVNIGQDVSLIEIIENDTLKFPRFLSDSVSTFTDSLVRMTSNDADLSTEIINNFNFTDLLKGSIGIKKTKDPVESKTNIDTEDIKSSKGNKPAVKEKKVDSAKEKIKIALSDENTIKAVSGAADNLINEIKMSIERYIQEYSKIKIEKIVLTGINLLNFDKYIKHETNYKVEKLDCSGYFLLDSLKKNPDFDSFDLYEILNPLAIGMALRGIKL